MAKYYALVTLAVALALGSIAWGVGGSRPYSETRPALSAHAYDDPTKPISDIIITAYHFVPANKADRAGDTSWKEPLAVALDELVRFHDLQFAGTSRLSYVIHPNSIVGKESSLFYDTEDTGRGNPHALQTIATEILERRSPQSPALGTYQVIYIIYEGVGAAGMPHVALVNKRFITDSVYGAFRSSLIAHEFYHTLGIPDGYDLRSGTSTTSDLMGQRRTSAPLGRSFLDPGTLDHLGL